MPFWFPAETIDTELPKELEMGAQLVSGHGQREAGLP
jgi:hypothetical protein